VEFGSVVVRVIRYWRYLPAGLPRAPPSVEAATQGDHVPSGVATFPVRVSISNDVPGGKVDVQSRVAQLTKPLASRTDDTNVPLETN
jgi:hypothetical protein